MLGSGSRPAGRTLSIHQGIGYRNRIITSIKFAIAIILTPVIYLIHGWIEKYLGHDLASQMKNAAMAKKVNKNGYRAAK